VTRPFLYLIGAPGSGKTTAITLACGTPLLEQRSGIVRYQVYVPGGIQLGGNRETHGGTDTLPLNVQPQAIRFCATTGAAGIVAEGDRLANDAFFQAIRDAGWDLTVAYTDVSREEADRRCAGRATTQNPAWRTGRHTKVERLAMRWSDPRWWFPEDLTPAEIAARLRTHPAIRVCQ
jgi:hypothetical protein